MSNQSKIVAELKKAVIGFKEDECRDAAFKVIESGMDPMIAVEQGLLPGIKEVGMRFDINEYFVPEVMFSTDALNAALEILRPNIARKRLASQISVVIGSIEGDVHDIGKNMVKIMFDAAGWKVHDLGRDVPLKKFVDKHMEAKTDIIAISAMMTTTMMGMKKIITMAKKENPDCLIMIGGASVTGEIADLFGADGYARSYGCAVDEGLKMMKRNRSTPDQ